MSIQSWLNSLRLSHTQFFLVGLLLGYASFILWLGIRLIVLISGGLIVIIAIASWFIQRQPKKITTSASSANLLQADIFLSHISSLDLQIFDISKPLWQTVQQQAQAIQNTAAQLAQREPIFIPDLLETLHTVLDLVEQLVHALQITQQIQTPRYREVAQQQLQSSLNRLQQTHDQLQELHDQVALERLERRSQTTSSGIAKRLQALIAENEQGILGE